MAKAKVVVYDARCRELVTALYNGRVVGYIPRKKNGERISIDNLVPIGGPFLLYEDADTPKKALTNLVKGINNYTIKDVDVLAVGGIKTEPFTDIDENTLYVIPPWQARIKVFHNLPPTRRPLIPYEAREYGSQIAVQVYKFK